MNFPDLSRLTTTFSSVVNGLNKMHTAYCRWEPVVTSTKQFISDSYELGRKIKLYARKPQLTPAEKAELVLDGFCTATKIMHLSMQWQEANNSKRMDEIAGLSDNVAKERQLKALKEQREEILKTQRVLQGVLGSAVVSRDLVKGKTLEASILDNVGNLALFFETCEKLHKGTEKAETFKKAREFINLNGLEHANEALKYMLPKIRGLFSNAQQQPNAHDLLEAFEDMRIPEEDIEDAILREVMARSLNER